MSLALKRAKLSRSPGEWSDEDYDVFVDGQCVGRIIESGSRFDPTELRWVWSITQSGLRRQGDQRHRGDTRGEDGKFRTAWEKVRAGRPRVSRCGRLRPHPWAKRGLRTSNSPFFRLS